MPPSEIARRRTFRDRWYRTPSFVAGATIVLALILAAIAAPLITRYDPNAQDLLHAYAHPSGAHWLGTDQVGRDVFTRLIYAGRSRPADRRSSPCSARSASAPLLGCLAGYYGGFVDTIVMRLVDIVVAFPFLVLVLALVFVLGPGGRSIVIAITAVGWVSYARIVRGEILVQKRLEYVLAARGRPLGRPHHRPPPAAERDHAGDRVLDERHRALDARDRHARLPRHRASRRPPPTGAR